MPVLRDSGYGEKMKILFIFPREKPYDSRSVRDFPCGGTEKATIFLGEALQKLGHDVTWVTTLGQMTQPIEPPDVVITQEAELLEKFPEARKVWWTHHFSDQPVIQRSAAYGRIFADAVVTLSQCQHDDFKSNLRIASKIIGHGVWLDEVQRFGIRQDERTLRVRCGYSDSFIVKDPYRLIYASTPFRGLERIPELFRAIKEREPRATIAICSSMGTYGRADQDKQYQPLFDELKGMDGVELLGALNQQKLYEQYARASIFFYPCAWRETYCLAMDEALAHGCIPIVSNIGALPERTPLGFCDSDELLLASIFKEMDTVNAPKRSYGLAAFSLNYADTLPRDWLGVAKEWEEKVLK